MHGYFYACGCGARSYSAFRHGACSYGGVEATLGQTAGGSDRESNEIGRRR